MKCGLFQYTYWNCFFSVILGTKVDLVFLVDASSVMKGRLSHVIAFVRSIYRSFPIGKGSTRVGLIAIGIRDRTIFHLKRYYKTRLLDGAMNMIRSARPRGPLYLARGFLAANNLFRRFEWLRFIIDHYNISDNQYAILFADKDALYFNNTLFYYTTKTGYAWAGLMISYLNMVELTS